MKEIHFLCLQLEKMMQEDIILDKSENSPNNKSFAKHIFEVPSERQEEILQQAIVSGLVENFSRIAPIFDNNGNEIKLTNKTKAFYESQESTEKLRIHQFSGLHGKNEPDHLVYSEVYELTSRNPIDGSIKVTHYMKGVTKVDNLNWLNNLGSELLI
jgi:hypothetical protein